MSDWTDLTRERIRRMAAARATRMAAEFADRNSLEADENVVAMPHARAVEEFGDGEQEAHPWVDRALREFDGG